MGMFVLVTLHPFAPAVEAVSFQFNTHQRNHFSFCNAKLMEDGFKRGAVFPGHFYDSIFIDFTELLHRFDFFYSSCTGRCNILLLPSISPISFSTGNFCYRFGRSFPAGLFFLWISSGPDDFFLP
jgi:hypothetical protein